MSNGAQLEMVPTAVSQTEDVAVEVDVEGGAATDDAKEAAADRELTAFEVYLGGLPLTKEVWFKEILCGVSVAIAQVPEAIAFR